jgi:predicted ATP-dependent endonuclease of OLD family
MLVEFFEGLAVNNQIIHTTHSPFLINTANIDRVKVVYVDKEGLTVCSANLRESDDKLNEKSVYAVHAALGLSVSDILLNGCQPIIVEGVSDQYYLNAIKIYLIRQGKFTPNKELVFMPSGGCTNKAVRAIAGLVCGRSGELPYIVLDSDTIGKKAAKSLSDDLYRGSQDYIIGVANVLEFDNGEIEDLLPNSLFNPYLNRHFSHLEDELNIISGQPILPQIESYAVSNGVDLEDGWKVQMAMNVKAQLMKSKTIISNETIEIWIKLFNHFSTTT